jgi:hypothetical protein
MHALFSVTCEWVHAKPNNRHPLQISLIHVTCAIQAHGISFARGTTLKADLEAIRGIMVDRLDKDTGEYKSPIPIPDHTCDICSQNDTDNTCAVQDCSARTHKCCTSTHAWLCTECKPPTLALRKRSAKMANFFDRSSFDQTTGPACQFSGLVNSRSFCFYPFGFELFLNQLIFRLQNLLPFTPPFPP